MPSARCKANSCVQTVGVERECVCRVRLLTLAFCCSTSGMFSVFPRDTARWFFFKRSNHNEGIIVAADANQDRRPGNPCFLLFGRASWLEDFAIAVGNRVHFWD